MYRAIMQMFPDPQVLLALEAEELGAKLLFLLRDNYPDGMFHLGHIQEDTTIRPIDAYASQDIKKEVEIAIYEAWSWLEAQGLIIQENSTNGRNGYRRLSRRARKFEDESEFLDYSVARMLPINALHPIIQKPVWMAFMRGEFDVAVFQAMKAVEVHVRSVSQLTTRDIGRELMRKAFHPENGALTDLSVELSERESISALFSGAIGSYKNPQSHRNVQISDPIEAMEIIMLANLLLRIVDNQSVATRE